MEKFIPYGKQFINRTDLETVLKVLKSDFLTQGPKIPEFEDNISNFVGAKYSVAVNSATSALHIACLALGLKSNDILWTSPNTFVASANCGLYCGSKIDFVDICPKTLNICPKLLEEKLVSAKKLNKLPKIIIIVHFGGNPSNMKEIYKLSKKFNFKIIEDASHALGAKYNNNFIGKCEFSDITTFSFHPVKIITTGEGGASLTNNKKLHDKMVFYRSHGITRNKEQLYKKNMPEWYYEQQFLGFNYRITDIQAALGTSQMKRLQAFIFKRNNLANYYKKHLSKLPLQLQMVDDNSYSSYHLMVIQLKGKKLINKRDQIFENMKNKNIGVNLHYFPVHLHPFYKDLGFKLGDFPNAENYSRKAITLPLHPQLTLKQIDYIIQSLKKEL